MFRRVEKAGRWILPKTGVVTLEGKRQGLTNEEKRDSARRRLPMYRKPYGSVATIVEQADVLADLGELCLAAGLYEMAEASFQLWHDSRLWYREELMEAEARWT